MKGKDQFFDFFIKLYGRNLIIKFALAKIFD